VTDIARLFQAFLAPAIFVSATALLILSINVRLMGIVGRLRQYVHAKHDATKNNRVQEAEAYIAQIGAIEQRSELIRRCFLLVLIPLPRRSPPVCCWGSDSTGKRPRWRASSFCSRNVQPAGRNHPLHSRSYRGAKFGAQRGTRFTVYGLSAFLPRFAATIHSELRRSPALSVESKHP